MTFNAVQYYEFGKGRGIIAPIFEPEYQAVLDYATANSITTPPLLQNIINNAIVLNLKNEDVWRTRDLFYYGKYDYTNDGLQNFSQLNWVDPTKYRLYNDNASLVPDYINNFGWKHNADGKFWKTGFIPKTNAVKTKSNDVGIFYKLFDFPTTFGTYNRIIGCRSANDSSTLHHINDLNNSFIIRTFNSNNVFIAPFSQAEINSHYINTKDNVINPTINNIILNNVIKTNTTFDSGSLNTATVDIVLLGFNNNNVYLGDGIGGMEYFSIGSQIKYNTNEVYNIMNGTYFDKKVSNIGVLALTTANTTLPTIYWLTPYLSSNFPSITTTKTYILLWSTDHSPNVGGIYWGECDDLDLNGFVERGKIIDGSQSETPYLFLYPNDIDGHIIHLYYHPDATHPDSGGYQQTRLLTTTGGLLHTTTWVDRGKVLGIINPPTTERHTGYCVPYLQNDNSIVAVHLTRDFLGNTIDSINRSGKSISLDGGRTYSRESSRFDTTSYMSFNRTAHLDQNFYFTRNSIQYLICLNSTYDMGDYTYRRISIFGCDGNYYPTSYIGNISIHQGGLEIDSPFFYKDGNTLHIYYSTPLKTEIYHTTFDLTQLD